MFTEAEQHVSLRSFNKVLLKQHSYLNSNTASVSHVPNSLTRITPKSKFYCQIVVRLYKGDF